MKPDYYPEQEQSEEITLSAKEDIKKMSSELRKVMTEQLRDMTTKYPGRLTYEDVLSRKRKLMTAISCYHIESIQPEDIFSEFVCRIMTPSKKDGLNYLERWDGSSSTPASWLYGALRNLCNTIKTRECTRGGEAVTHASSIRQKFDEEDENGLNTICVSTILVDNGDDDDARFIAEELMKIAAERYSTFSSKSSAGIERSPFIVLKYMLDGYSRSEIAELLEVSTTFIASLIKKILNDPQVRVLQSEYASL